MPNITLELINSKNGNFYKFIDITTPFLDFTNWELKFISYDISKLKQLSELYLNYNCLNNSLTNICYIENLRILTLANCNLTNIPVLLYNLRNLELLDLSNNSLKEIPVGISKLSKLETLDLGDNKLMKLPNDINNLPKLNYLFLNNNKTINIPINNNWKLTRINTLNTKTKSLKGVFKLTNIISLKITPINYLKIYKMLFKLKNIIYVAINKKYDINVSFNIHRFHSLNGIKKYIIMGFNPFIMRYNLKIKYLYLKYLIIKNIINKNCCN